jgi:deoxyribonucleoside regulator
VSNELSPPNRSQDALRAAHLYYLQDLTMEAIAQELQTSRSTVSRLLSQARASGLVDIQIRSPLDSLGALEKSILERFQVSAHVVPVPDNASDIDRLERVALSVARILGRYFYSNMTLGIALGSTVSAISRHLVPKVTHNSHIVQLNGAGNVHTTGLSYAGEMLQRFGHAFGAHVQPFPSPTFFDDPATKRAFWKESSVRRVLAIQAGMDVALFGLGAPTAEVASHVYAGGYLGPEDYEALAESDVVGDLATVFFRADGTTTGIPLNDRATGPDFAVFRQTPRRICVVSGVAKLAALKGALNAHVITELFLDESTARALVLPDLNG